jgi:hypothetical protein
MRLKDDSACKEDLQAGRAWGDLGFKIADEIDRAMCAAEGIAALQRAADLAVLGEWASSVGGYMQMWSTDKMVHIEIGNRTDAADFNGPDAIAEAAARCRQRGGA